MQTIRKRALPSKKQPLEQESSDEANQSSDDDSEVAQVKGNAGWADSISKVLNSTKPKTKKTLVLSRAKKIKASTDAVKKPIDYGFEVDGAVEVKEEETVVKQEEPAKKERKNKQLALRVKPNWRDIEQERTLRKIATRGVVQLFNAVRMEQKDLQHKMSAAGPLDSRKEAVLNNINKKKFLDVLMGGKRAKSESIDNAVKNEESSDCNDNDDLPSSSSKQKSEWNVLRSDYMTNKKIKHWDEEDDDNNSDNAGDQTDDDDGDE